MHWSSAFRSTLKTNVLHVSSMYRSSPFRSTANRNDITGLDMCQVCTEAVHSAARRTRTISQVWTCFKYVPNQSIPYHFEHERYRRFGHVSSMYRSKPFRSTLNRNVITGLYMCQICTEAFCSTFNTNVITVLDMCQVCTEAAHSVALRTRTISQVWTCVKYVPKQSIPQHVEHERYHRFGHVSSMYQSSLFRSTLNTNDITGLDMYQVCTESCSPSPSTLNMNIIAGLDMCQVCTEANHSVALWTRTSSQVCTCVKYVLKHSVALWTQTCQVCTEAVHSVPLWTQTLSHVSSMYRSSPFRSTSNRNDITGLDMCQVCTEAVHSAARRTRTISQVWTCFKYVPKQPIPKHFEHERYRRFGHVSSMHRISPSPSTLNMNVMAGLDMCQVCTEANHSVALWTRTSSQVCTCVKYVLKHSVALWTQTLPQVWTCVKYALKQCIP